MPVTQPDRRTVLVAGGALAVFPGKPAAAPARSLTVGDRLERFDWLVPGVRTYLRTLHSGAGTIAVDVWRREVRISSADGVDRMRITQRWDGADQPGYLVELDSLFELQTFRPLSHVRNTVRDGTTTVEGFLFEPGGVRGMPDLPGNSRTEFAEPSAAGMYNFETDLELLQTLPLDYGYSVSIPFYHPGGGPPARYDWTVTGDVVMRGPDGSPMDCWIVETSYGSPEKPPARFHFAKRNQQFLRLDRDLGDGRTMRKAFLSSETGQP